MDKVSVNVATDGGPPIDLPDWLHAVLSIDPEGEALHFDGRWFTWGWLARGVEAVDEVLVRHGLGDGVKVGVLIRNRPEIVRAITATLATRRCLVTLSSAIPPTKLAAELEQMRLGVVVATREDWTNDEFRSAVVTTGSLGVVVVDGEPPAAVVVPAGRVVGHDAPAAPGIAVEMLTSGTTGPPKRIDLSYRGLEFEIASTAQYSSGGLGEPRLSSGTALIWNPLLHIGGLRGLITSLVGGRRIAMLERFSVDAWAAMVRAHRPKVISLVPAALAMVYDADLPAETFDGVSAVFSGTAPLDPELGRQFHERYGVPVLVVYGATEFAGGVAGWTLTDWRRCGDTKTGSVGRPNAGVRVRIVDQDTGDELPLGQVGLLEVEAPQLSTPGWLRTTDLGRMDEDDFIWITGRADDVIVRGGFKVATNAVRDVIVEHPAVLDACVVGIPDRRLGHVPVAAVELRRDADPASADDLIAWARERLSRYEVPIEIMVVGELPRTPSMKVSQVAVRSMFDGRGSPVNVAPAPTSWPAVVEKYPEPVTGAEPLDASTRLEIHELAARYGSVIDDRDWDGLASVFTDDAVFVLHGFPGGDVRLEGLSAIREQMTHGRHPVAHHVTNVLVDVGPDGVGMRSKIIGSGAKGRVGSADYRDRLRRTVDGWRIAERVVTLRSAVPPPPAL